jgi:prepilin-type N-terminal cleavage/methylation domain-containing protein
MAGTHFIGCRKRGRGFSLAEVLVVVVIISFASAMAILAYSNSRKSASVEGAAERIRSMMVNARFQAIADSYPSQIVFDLTNQQVWIDALDGSGQIRVPKIVAPEILGSDVVLETVKINSTTYSQGLAMAVFTAEGTNPLVTVNLRREFDDASISENYYSVQMYPSSSEPKVWPNVRK